MEETVYVREMRQWLSINMNARSFVSIDMSFVASSIFDGGDSDQGNGSS